MNAEHYKARWQHCLIRISEILNPKFIFEASSPGRSVKVKGLVFFQSKHIYDGKCTSKSKIPALCTNCINLKRLLWSISSFAKQFCSGRRSQNSQKGTLCGSCEWEGRVRSKLNIPKTLWLLSHLNDLPAPWNPRILELLKINFWVWGLCWDCLT